MGKVSSVVVSLSSCEDFKRLKNRLMKHLYPYEDFAKLREEMAKLEPGRLLFVMSELQPDQLRELDADRAFVVVSGRENRGDKSFYCIARAIDLELAITVSSRVIQQIGGRNINVSNIH